MINPPTFLVNPRIMPIWFSRGLVYDEMMIGLALRGDFGVIIDVNGRTPTNVINAAVNLLNKKGAI